jgi:hypothetical protein
MFGRARPYVLSSVPRGIVATTYSIQRPYIAQGYLSRWEACQKFER